ncbi:PEGA domain-containing protein [Vibrio sp. 10N.222.54.B12]|uniref:PEGA domain-containing protein n=1 Tax=unclassified Vibrio TaxID=2614977 RepID=UPI00355177AD
MKKVLLTVMTGFALSGCAGIMSGGDDKLTVATTTSDAKIYVDGRYLGEGRISTQVKRGDNYEIRINKEGCATIYETTGDKLDGWFWANILIDWGIISMPVDLISGSAWKLDKEEYILIPECD